MKIVPDSDKLELAARLSPADVDQVLEAQSVWIRFPGLNMRRTPDLSGRVLNVSADLSFDDKIRESFYEVRVALDQGRPVEFLNIELVLAMPADAFIRTESHTVVSYLVQPLIDQMQRAFREE